MISSSSAWAHAVICDERAIHVSYCHNPFRYAWNERHRTLAERSNPVSRAVLSRLFRRWREWDWIAAQRVDRYVTNSRTTQARIKAYFGRESRIIYPPVATRRFRQQPLGDHYLVLSELVSHKQIDVAIEAFNRLRLPLVVTGGGPDGRRLRRLAGPTVRFAGRVSDAEAARLLASCRALVVTTGEEFGIAAVEAQAAGRPVIARAAGGLLENVAGRGHRLPLGGRRRRACRGGQPVRHAGDRLRGLHRERTPLRRRGVPREPFRARSRRRSARAPRTARRRGRASRGGQPRAAVPPGGPAASAPPSARPARRRSPERSGAPRAGRAHGPRRARAPGAPPPASRR